MSALTEMRKHRDKHNLDIYKECKGFFLDDHIKYIKDGKEEEGYIMCFRKFDYTWFAWIYVSKEDFTLKDCIFIGDLIKIEDE